MNYIIEVPGYELTAADVAQEDVVNEARSMCAIDSLKTLMKYGATFERIYRNKKGAVVYEVKVDRKRCRKLG